MIDAKEARSISETAQKEYQETLAEIESKIKRFSANGETSIFYSGCALDAKKLSSLERHEYPENSAKILNILKNSGYSVEKKLDGLNQLSFKISW
ncbi:hypothetical protein SDC64_07565 [Acinetobacter haemolyticus]|uniref:hypothetical protein n=1 Tax=Acinetobacter haemolyticus TaxID=29430 RepID=UPI002A6B5C98|nr:hypothetical protein [Acinetobacter haemolyticus]WPO68768.1 hypothetical protein SDC64_07565 [Acinetobacter haemolyticus]